MSPYSIGIDLGTTNSAVSYFNLAEAKARGTAQTMLAIPQSTSVGTVEEKLLLPSFLYLPNDRRISRRQSRIAVGQEAQGRSRR